MATRQYIGARYVPEFYTNSVDGSTQWEANVVYESLIYVTLQNGHMYLSKKQVPATIGTPASNVDYWLDVGNYNGFIEELQNEIDAVETNIARMGDINRTSNKAIFIGDSFMVGGVQQSIANKFGITSANAYYYGNTGAGFARINPVGEPYGGYNFKGLLEMALLDVTGDNLTGADINYIFVLGGINDQNETLADFESAVNSFMAYAKNNFPNARVIVGCNAPLGAVTFNYRHMMDIVYAYVDMYGFYSLRGIENTLYHMSNLVDSDNIHPNANGTNVLGYNMKAMYLGNDPFARSYEYDANGTYFTGKVKVKIDKEKVCVNYALTSVDASGASTGITLQERAVPGFVVCDAPGCNVPGAYAEINTGGVVNVWGTKNVGTLYSGSFEYPVNVH